MTCDESIGDDVNKLFQQLTGMGKALKIKKLFHAPFTLHSRLISLIEREAGHGEQGRIIFKFNALTETQLIKALYRASRAGVKIDLIVRGICCLRPGVPGLSENIRVRSIIGRFLEHTRVYYFGNNGHPEFYCSSADGMERNLLSRVETAFPIEAPALQARLPRRSGNLPRRQLPVLVFAARWQLYSEPARGRRGAVRCPAGVAGTSDGQTLTPIRQPIRSLP